MEVVSVGMVPPGYYCVNFTEYVLLLINRNSISCFQVNEELPNAFF